MKEKKKKTLVKRLVYLTFVFLFIGTCVFAPFMTIEGASQTLGFILLGIIILSYVVIFIINICDWLKKGKK